MEENRQSANEFDIPFQKKKEVSQQSSAPVKKPFRIPAPAWFAIGCAVVLGTVLAGWRVRESILGRQIALLDSSRPVFAGYSGGGYIGEDFAPEQHALSLLEQEVTDRQQSGRNTDDLVKLIQSVSCSFEKDSGYANQDSLIYACTYDASAAAAAKIRLTDTMKTYTVSGLAEYTVLDVFAGVSADWQIDGSSLSIGLNVPQELLDMGISYSYSYGGDSYNGETIDIHAEFDQNALMSYGYVVSTDEITYTLGAMPELITDIDSLSEEELAYLRDTFRSVLENEISGCGGRAVLSSFTGSYSIEITDIGEAYIEKPALNFFEGSSRFRITYRLETRSDFILQDLGSFTASYTGSLYRMPDQTIRFITDTVHACEFTGVFGSYSLKEGS